MKLGVIGSGSWGLALSNAFAIKESQIFVCGRNQANVDSINQNNTVSYFENFKLSKNIKAFNSYSQLENVDVIFVSIPVKVIREVLVKIKEENNIPEHVDIYTCCKGIEQNSLMLTKDICQNIFPNNFIGVISGPSFASEVVQNQKTYVNLYCKDSKSFNLLQSNSSDNLIFQRINDDIGIQICGVLKNIIAVACGIATGMNLGNNFLAYLVTQGLLEMKILAKTIGGQEETLNQLCGIGDLVLTCNSMNSRNNKFGYLIATSNQKASNLINNNNQNVEAINSAISVNQIIEKYNLSEQMPICSLIYKILHQNIDYKIITNL